MYRALPQEFINSPMLMYLSGLLGLLAGLALVLTHNARLAADHHAAWLGERCSHRHCACPEIDSDQRENGDEGASIFRGDRAVGRKA
jgi:hypothetical protein